MEGQEKVKETGVLFRPDMVQAMLRKENPKRQTRRIIKPRPPFDTVSSWQILASKERPQHVGKWEFLAGTPQRVIYGPIACPHGNRGDLLYVKESWQTARVYDDYSPTQIYEKAYRAGHVTKDSIWPAAPLWYDDGKTYRQWGNRHYGEWGGPGRMRSPLHMPKWAARIWLELTKVDVQRLYDISDEDAIAEGIEQVTSIGPLRAMGWKDYLGGPCFLRPRDSYISLFKLLHGEDIGNPWVWAEYFKLLTNTGEPS